MILEPENATHLKPWLVRTLEPICDAEPGALADYILALLKHNAPESELREELTSQLEEFLEKETRPFIDTLFTALRTKSYLPYSSSAFASSSTHPIDTGIPIPLDGLLSGSTSTSPDRRRKRSVEQDDLDGHASAKGPRLSHDGQFSRYGRGDGRTSWGGHGARGGRMGVNGRADYMDGGMNGAMDPGMGGLGMNGRGQYQPPPLRGVCRDYHNNGYCARGAYCKYSHGDDAVIPSQIFPMGGAMPNAMPFLPMMANGGMGFNADAAAYNPHERMDMRPPGGGNNRSPHSRAPLLPRHGELNGHVMQKPGELPVIQDLTPQIPDAERPPRTSQQNGADGAEPAGYPAEGMGAFGMMNGGGMPVGYPQDVEMGAPMPMAHMRRGGYRGGRGSGGRGVFGGDVQSFRPEKRQGTTLVVEKIPEDKLSLGAVNEWFKRFGTVTNVAVDPHTSKALVTFSDHKEAHAAWKSEDAVFSNRFVKVFWHRPMEGHGQLGKQMLAASASLVSNIAAKEAAPATSSAADSSSAAPTASTSTHIRKSSTSAASSLAAKQRLLEQQIAEQKSLMAQLSTTTGQEKRDIMARLRKLNEEMKPSTPQPPPPAAAPPVQPTSLASNPSRVATPRSEAHERVERERLDKELEIHSVVAAVGTEAEESTEDLQAKLAKLKAEAASLGLPEFADAPPLGTSYRPYRGRGRGGRSYYRGAMRGGPPRGSMKLDNRPKKLLVKGVSSDDVQAVRDWYETTGQVDTFETTESGDILVSFRSRAAAEQGFAKGSKIAAVGPVQVSWYTNQGSTSHTPTPHRASSTVDDTSALSDKATVGGESEAGSSSTVEPDDSHLQDVEVGGWGGDDTEDQFGMI